MIPVERKILRDKIDKNVYDEFSKLKTIEDRLKTLGLYNNKEVLKKKLYRLTNEIDFSKKISQNALKHRFLVGVDASLYMFDPVVDGWADFGDTINWKKFQNSEKTFKINRLTFLVSLGLMCYLTNNQDYARGGLTLIREWYTANPFPGQAADHITGTAWRSLDAAMRIFSILWFFIFVCGNKNISSEEKTFLLQMLEIHGRYLYKLNCKCRHFTGNWQIYELSALVHLSILVPELKNASVWRLKALSELENHITRQFYNDGVHGEGSLSYHVGITQQFLNILFLAKTNKVPVSRHCVNFIRKMVDFIVHVMRPDKSLPYINDSYLVDLNTLILSARNIFSKYSWLQISGKGTKDFYLHFYGLFKNNKSLKKSAVSKKIPSRYFKHAGFSIMRGDINKRPAYLFFDADRGWFPHTHAGKLSFDLYACGTPMIVDSGNCSYDHYSYGTWYKRTAAHNTVCINGIDQTLRLDTWQWNNRQSDLKHLYRIKNIGSFLNTYSKPDVRTIKWISNKRFDYVESEHDGYLQLTNPIIHNRKIIFIKGKYWILIDTLKSMGEHLTFNAHYEQLMHFYPSYAHIDSNSIVTAVNGNTGIQVVPLHKEESDEFILDKGKIIFKFKMIKTPLLRYRKHGRGSIVFITLLLPFYGKKPDVHVEPLLMSTQNNMSDGEIGSRISLNGKKTDIFYMFDKKDPVTLSNKAIYIKRKA